MINTEIITSVSSHYPGKVNINQEKKNELSAVSHFRTKLEDRRERDDLLVVIATMTKMIKIEKMMSMMMMMVGVPQPPGVAAVTPDSGGGLH